uniref:DM13 domain-containing protein n=1 Tax=Romanomermis culicivorax TaxID=13658 RepID=A0A915IS21_ROMCU
MFRFLFHFCSFTSILLVHGHRTSTAYYGQPLGAIYYAADGTQGEAYAADAKTISIINFHHKPQKDCTTFIAGLKTKPDDTSKSSSKDAILLPVRFRKFGRSKRDTDATNVRLGGGIKWEASTFPKNAVDKNVGGTAGTKGNEIAAPSGLRPTGVAAAPSVDPSGVRHSAPERLPVSQGVGIKWDDKDDYKPLRPRWFGPLPKASPGFYDPVAAVNVEKVDVKRTSVSPPLSRRNLGASQPSSLLPEKVEKSSFSLQLDQSIKTNKSEILISATNSPEKRPELGGIVIHPAGFQRHQWLDLDNTTDLKLTEEPKAITTVTPLFVFVDDPRHPTPPPKVQQAIKSDVEKNQRDFNVDKTRKISQLGGSSKQKLQDIPIPSDEDIKKEKPSTVDENKPMIPPAPEGMFYVLPETFNDEMALAIPDPYTLSDFEYFGIYDHCRHAKTATISLRGIEVPKEVELEGLSGWQYDVKSDKVKILNCNTILITNMTYNGAGKTDAYVYAGNGNFPDSIAEKTRVELFGVEVERSLKNKTGQNVYVKLPKGWKTMDLTWLAVYNPKENVSYGHVAIPKHYALMCEESEQ